MKMLFVDVETSPNIVHAWGLFNQFIGINQIVEPSKVISWAAKWYDEDRIMFDSLNTSSQKQMLSNIHKLISEADVLVTYNGRSFDLPVLNRDFILNGFDPPKPSQDIDLLSVVRKQFKFASNKLQYVVQALGLGNKVEHEGHGLWVKCLEWDQDAWKIMREYNENDVILLEALYNKVKGWIKVHPNMGLYTEAVEPCCPNCGGTDLSPRGYRYTQTRKYKRYKCRNRACGRWASARLSERGDIKVLLA